jgi:hypothetical protein
MPESLVVHTLRSARLAMNAVDDEVTRKLADRWLRLEAQLSGNIAALANEMVRRTEAGEVITGAMIRRSERYQILLDQLRNEVAKYNKDALKIISAGQANAVRLGVDAAQNAILVSLPTSLDSAFNRINIKAVEAIIGMAGDGSPLMTLLVNDFKLAADGIIQTLINGVARGMGADATARAMVEAAGMGMDRALLIARTELNRAYRTSSTETYKASGVVEGWMRLVARDEACASCLAEDGAIYTSEAEFDEHPRGRCSLIPVLKGMDAPEWEKAQDWFANQPESKQRETLGNARYEMYKNGMSLQDFTHRIHSDEWGDSPALIPLSDLEK